MEYFFYIHCRLMHFPVGLVVEPVLHPVWSKTVQPVTALVKHVSAHVVVLVRHGLTKIITKNEINQ